MAVMISTVGRCGLLRNGTSFLSRARDRVVATSVCTA